jgi:thioredoxin 1
MHVHEITDANFEREVTASALPVLLDFTATWCPPCRHFGPVVDAFAAETVGRVKVGKVDIDSAPGLSNRFQVRAAPTTIVLLGGREVARYVGATSKSKLHTMIPITEARAG